MKTIKIITLFAIMTASQTLFAQRVLNDDERTSLVNSPTFREKCEWAIRNYADYQLGSDGTGMNAAALDNWRKQYQILKSVKRADYVDSQLSLRFVILSKGMQFNVDADPTPEEIIALFVSSNRFEELSALYFGLLSE